MAELGVAGSAVGVASLGIQICQGLLSFYNDWKDHDSDISSAYDSITDLCRSLGLLKGSLERGRLDGERSERVKRCLQACEGSLTELSEKLQELRKYGDPQTSRQKVLSQVQRLKYPFQAKTLRKMRENVESVQGRLELALQVLQLDSSTNVEVSVAQIVCQQQQILATQQSDQFRKIVNWIAPPDPWTNHASARQKHKAQTCFWLLECDQYKKWKDGSIRHVWMYGKAGCGKTVLCSEAIEDIKAYCQSTTNIGFAAFYFTFSDDRKQGYEGFLRSIVSQLAYREPALPLLQDAYEKDRKLGVDELNRILFTALHAYKDVFLLLDALDECPENGEARQHMLEYVEDLSQRAPNLKILTISRELRDIRQSMEMLAAERIIIDTHAVDADIQRYVSIELSHDRRLKLLSPQSQEDIKKTIARKSDGMFRWAYCQLQELKRLPDVRPSYVRKALHDLPVSLDETYTRMLSSIGKHYVRDAHTLLQWLAYARSPLTLAQLVETVIIDPASESVDIEDRGTIEGTLNILSGLVTIVATNEDEGFTSGDEIADSHTSHDNVHITVDTKVRLAHFSVKEYLESSRMLEHSAKDFHIQPPAGHRFLMHSCLTYLTHYSNVCESLWPRPYWSIEPFPLLSYAAETWSFHSSLQQCSDADREVLFLSSVKQRQDWYSVHRLEATRMNPYTQNFGSAIYFASLLGLQTVVHAILEQENNDIDAPGGYYGNALQVAAAKGHLKIVELLLRHNSSVNSLGGFFNTALQAAAANGHLPTVELLLKRNCDVNVQGGFYNSALQAATFQRHTKIVQLLLGAGADVNVQGGQYGNALQAVARHDSVETVKLLLKAGADVNAQGGLWSNALQAASLEGNKEVVELLLKVGADVNAQGGKYGNALQAASLEGNKEVVELLLKVGADVNAQGGEFGSALQAASCWNNLEVVELLLKAGADVNAQGGEYGNALQAASRYSLEAVKLLLQAGADVHAPGRGEMVGHYSNAREAAAHQGHVDVVQLLSNAMLKST